MVRIELSSASNGVIKKTIDDNFDGNGNVSTNTTLYLTDIDQEPNDGLSLYDSYRLIYDINEELSLGLNLDSIDDSVEFIPDEGVDETIEDNLDNLDYVNQVLAALKDETSRFKKIKKQLESKLASNEEKEVQD